MKKINLHSHTTFCDGLNSAEEMVLSAIDKGLDVLGFSGHSYLDFDESWCMSQENTQKYIQEVAGLKQKYKDQITILCGIEQDYMSNTPTCQYDYVIGSVHVIPKDGNFIAVDYSSESLLKAIAEHYDGDPLALAEDYYMMMGDLHRKTNCHIVGHFDLLTKFNEKAPIFDTSHPRYVAAVDRALSELVGSDVVFEVNTGAISRGYTTLPYPSADILKKLCEKGAKVIISSDTHSVDTVNAYYDKALSLIKAAGFTKISAIDSEGNFYEENI
ncbi:MAG: histidinol-phosphatase [Firmicutes bacterium]|nr:histidinol-phosphatase [Bacillota bacterium]